MGLAEKLGLTKNSTFIATVEIHELLQVPLVQGKFRIKWKFKGSSNSHFGSDLIDGDEVNPTSNGTGLLNGFVPGNNNYNNNKKGPLGSLVLPRTRGVSVDSTGNRDSSTAEESSNTSSTSRRPSRDYHNHQRSLSSTPNSPFSESRTPNPNKTPTVTTNGFNYNSHGVYNNNTSSNPTSPHMSRNASPDIKDRMRLNSESESGGGALFSPSSTYHSVSRASELPELLSPSLSAPPSTPYTPRIAESKGSTNLVSLRSHSATFNREINCIVSIPLRSLPSSSNYALQPSPMRLSVRQEVIGIHGQKEEIKTGEVILDLSQFAGTSNGNDVKSSRRYLLRDSKTNATLRVTVKMEWIGGESKYVAPPLRSGQVKESTTSSNIISTPTSNRSSTSLSSRKVASLQTREGGITMTRTNSAQSGSTISLRSNNSTPLNSSSPPNTRKKGWHPSSSAFSSPAGIGEVGTIERNAHDIIDNLFNRADYRLKSNDALKGTINNDKADSQVELIAGKKAVGMNNNQNNSKGKEKEKEGWFKIKHPIPQPLSNLSPHSTTINLSPLSSPPIKLPNQRPLSTQSLQSLNSNSSSKPLPLPPQPPSSNSTGTIPQLPSHLNLLGIPVSRKFSQSSVVSKSIRWDDDKNSVPFNDVES